MDRFSKCYCIFLLVLDHLLAIAALEQDYYWRDYKLSDIPCDAFLAAPDRYIGIAEFHGNSPITVYPHSKIGVIAGATNKIILKRNIKIMCTSTPMSFQWEYVNFTTSYDRQMKNAVVGGYRSDILTEVFIGKVNHANDWKIGRVIPADHQMKGLWVWNEEGESIRVYEFYLLKYNSTNPACACTVEPS